MTDRRQEARSAAGYVARVAAESAGLEAVVELPSGSRSCQRRAWKGQEATADKAEGYRVKGGGDMNMVRRGRKFLLSLERIASVTESESAGVGPTRGCSRAGQRPERWRPLAR